MSEQAPQYSSLRDYLALLRRQRLVVLAVTLAFGGAALALSASQEPSYESQASIQTNDLSRELAILGNADLPAATNPLVDAAVKSEEVTSLATARQVQRELKTDVSPERLQSAISARVGSQTIFVQITAEWDDANFATDVANAFAEVTVTEENNQFERQLETAIEVVKPRAEQDVLRDDASINLPVFNAQNQLSALTTLQAQVEDGTIVPAEIARRAEVPDAPSSPRTARNTVLGLIVGLALGLLAAFVRDSLDRRIRSAKDAHEAFGLPVLARVGKSALGSTGLARSANGAGFATPADIESFRILRTNLAALLPGDAPRTVLVTSGLPQEGKSTVASSLAAASAAAGQRTLLVDGDLRRPVLAKRLGLPDTPGLSEYLSADAEPRDILNTVRLSAMGNGAKEPAADADKLLVCIPAGNPAGEPAELLASDRCRDFLGKVSRAYDLVVIDSSPLLASADPLELIPHVDSVLICVRLTDSHSDEARAVNEAVGLLPDRPIGLVVTGAGPSDGYYGYYGY
jgi:capsular exopolysaccharide synthesis family protein